nr:MAG TPA: hypothetical protein [Caudoviricetes sp.]
MWSYWRRVPRLHTPATTLRRRGQRGWLMLRSRACMPLWNTYLQGIMRRVSACPL